MKIVIEKVYKSMQKLPFALLLQTLENTYVYPPAIAICTERGTMEESAV